MKTAIYYASEFVTTINLHSSLIIYCAQPYQNRVAGSGSDKHTSFQTSALIFTTPTPLSTLVYPILPRLQM